ncbi:MAG: serine hydrolase [Bacillota bacterium]|nr:serine hydrolase [Bacillota bacterium]
MKPIEPFFSSPSPEHVGIPSEAVLRFLERIDRERICMHGFLLLRHGQIAAEGYWAPFTPERLHRMYSVSKSFVSLAVGLLIDDGKLSLNDPVVSFFPDKVPQDIHPWLAGATVRDLLMMATPHSQNAYTMNDPDWAWCFFNKAPSHPAGTIFAYDTAATVVLNTIVERISGMPFLDFMRPRLLDPIGFSRDAWCVKTPEGTSWGGSGVQCTLRDLAKVALLCLNQGRWGDKQLISQAYVAAATSKQIDNSISGNVGYGYQIWRDNENGFSFRGMGSQLALCFPDKYFIFTCISDTQGAGSTGEGIYEAMWEELYPHLAEKPLTENKANLAALNSKISQLQVLPQPGEMTSPLVGKIDSRWYVLEDNPMGISRMKLTFEKDSVLWRYTNGQGDNELRFGIGHCLAGVFPQKNYFGSQIGVRPGIPYKCLASAAWVETHKLNLLVYITDDYFGTLKMTISFKEDEIALYMTKVAEWFLDEYQGFAGGKAAVL